MRNQILHPRISLNQNLSKNTGRHVENTNKKIVFLWQICQFNHYGWLIFLEFYWFFNSNSQELIVGAFSYKAHFRPQISSNAMFLTDGQNKLMFKCNCRSRYCARPGYYVITQKGKMDYKLFLVNMKFSYKLYFCFRWPWHICSSIRMLEEW